MKEISSDIFFNLKQNVSIIESLEIINVESSKSFGNAKQVNVDLKEISTDM